MQKDTILVTGAAGFIGFHFCKYLLEKSENTEIFGIDSLSNYYDVNLKNEIPQYNMYVPIQHNTRYMQMNNRYQI